MKINFQKLGSLVPVVIQDYKTQEVFMLGFMNMEAFKKTKESGFVWFYSRLKKRLWMKGESSGNKLRVMRIAVDCDNDTLLIWVRVLGEGKVCHIGMRTCFKEFNFFYET